MSDLRLGDVIDDYCVKCRRVTNHSIVSMLALEPAKMRCRTCYHEHDYRRCEVPPKKDSKKEALFKEVLSTVAPTPEAPAETPAKKGKAGRKKV
jgi:hypothetical protein